jgi:uncharacterized membrane protein
MAKKRMRKMLRNYFITGAIFIIPIWITVALVKALVNLIMNTFSLLPPAYQPRTYIDFPGFELLVALALIFLLGLLTSNILGKKLVAFSESLVAKIPVVKTIYQGIKHLTTGIFSDKKIFQKAVLIEFPIQGMTFIGFITGEDFSISPQNSGQRIYKIFIPTTPNPTSGFFCFAPENQIKPLDLSVDEAFKLIISAGYADPQSF